jgi:hypothetical protein
MVMKVKTVAAVEDVVTLVVVVALVAAVEVALLDEVEVVMTGQILLMALMYFWIMKLQKEITNKTMRSQSKCWIQRRRNTAMIGEPTERGMRY